VVVTLLVLALAVIAVAIFPAMQADSRPTRIRVYLGRNLP
jgi:hypothetical protein